MVTIDPSRESVTYHADIQPADQRNGTFDARLRGSTIAVRSRDPEHDLCHAIFRAALPDGSIQFWRGQAPSLLFKSVHLTAQFRIELGEHCPYRRVERRSGEDLKNSRCGVAQDGDFALGGYHPTSAQGRGSTDASATGGGVNA